jgi:hypothetical protein
VSLVLSKRSFLFGAGASLIVAPAIVSAANIMPVKAFQPLAPILIDALYGAVSYDGPWEFIGPADSGGYFGVVYPASALAVRGHDSRGYAFLKRDEAWIRDGKIRLA